MPQFEYTVLDKLQAQFNFLFPRYTDAYYVRYVGQQVETTKPS